jgi:hypothetical protein
MSGETEADVSGWTVDTVRVDLQRQILAMAVVWDRQLNDFRVMLQERYETQTKAIEAAFVASQTAMQTALTSAEKAVQTASTAAEKAVTKQEIATEKRFESVNEFRQTLTDQAGTFMTRGEAQASLASAERAASADHDRLAEMVPRGEMTLQFENLKGQMNGMNKAITDVSQLLASVRAGGAGRDRGVAQAEDAADRMADVAARTRTLVVSVLAVIGTLVIGTAGLLIGLAR